MSQYLLKFTAHFLTVLSLDVQICSKMLQFIQADKVDEGGCFILNKIVWYMCVSMIPDFGQWLH